MMTPAEVFSLLSDETRLRCLSLVYRRGKLCVCELVQALSSTQPKISRHLSLLRNHGFLVDERKGQWVYYDLNPALPGWVKEMIKLNLEAVGELEPYTSDVARAEIVQGKRICDA